MKTINTITSGNRMARIQKSGNHYFVTLIINKDQVLKSLTFKTLGGANHCANQHING